MHNSYGVVRGSGVLGPPVATALVIDGVADTTRSGRGQPDAVDDASTLALSGGEAVGCWSWMRVELESRPGPPDQQ